jgi:hypothetical protein
VDTTIIVKADELLKLTPQDFANRAVVRGVTGDEPVILYAALRVIGFDQLSTFAACFADFVTCRFEAAQAAAEAFETTKLFERLTDEVTDVLGEERVQKELSARLREASGFTHDAAMATRVEFKFQPRALRDQENDARAFDAFREQRLSADRNRNEMADEFDSIRRNRMRSGQTAFTVQ